MDTQVQSVRQRADECFAAQNFGEAVDLYQQVLVAEPTAHSVQRSLGLSLAALKRFDEAIVVCEAAVKLQPADADVRYALGYALAGSKRFDEAIKELDGVLYLQPNHVQAKQMVIYSLLQRAQRDIEDSPHTAEQDLDRAHKLDPKNAEVTANLLGALVASGQRGKSVALYEQLDAAAKAHPAIAPVVARMESDPNFQSALKQVAMKQQTAPAAAPQKTTQTLDQVPCPNCKQLIMSYAAICPHCNFQIRAYGTFAGRDTGPSTTWQEVAYTIVAVIWTLMGAVQLVLAFSSKDAFFRSFLMTVQGANTVIGVGLIFRVEWIMFVAKILCYVNLGFGAYGMMVGFGFGDWKFGLFATFQLALAGFMVYLINYVGD